MTTSAENTPIYSNAISEWMATHQGRMPGVVPSSGEPQDETVVDTPYMDDVAKNGISPWFGHRQVSRPMADPNPNKPPSPRSPKGKVD
jgi:hypothetical protein